MGCYSSTSVVTTYVVQVTTVLITCQPPEYKNLEMSRNLCILRISLKTTSRNKPRKSPGDLMKNLETPGKTGRVGRYGVAFEAPSLHLLNNLDYA